MKRKEDIKYGEARQLFIPCEVSLYAEENLIRSTHTHTHTRSVADIYTHAPLPYVAHTSNSCSPSDITKPYRQYTLK